MNTITLFNQGWHFAKGPLELESNESLIFQPVEIPHDWLIQDTNKLYENGIGWYKKTFTYEETDENILLEFDGVYMDSALFVNQQFIGDWKYGYSTFEMDITQALKKGENEIILKVTHQSPSSRWYSGAGIYRNVWLKRRGNNYIETNGIYISTKRSSPEDWVVNVDTDLQVTEEIRMVHKLIQGLEIVTSIEDRVSSSQKSCKELTVSLPELWSPESPNLYELKTELWSVEAKPILIEEIKQNIGFRTIELSPSEGFLLNDKKIKINGVCEHHDLGALGAAFNPVALKRRLHLLKEMGVNGIRTSHNMPAKELMVMADKMGFFIVSEAFDMWERPKTTYDYSRFFNDWVYQDVKSWVKRDRNHPSLLMWSIGNEIYDTHADKRGQEITKMLQEYVLEFDPHQNGYVTIGSNYMPWENAQKCADIVKIAGYNYAEKYYQPHHEQHPDWVVYGSETASVVQSRGIYHFPYGQAILSDDDLQCSALGNSTTSWGAKSAEACIIAERDTPFSLGQFIWTGFDYIGEPTPYHTKNSYFGQLDTATFPKDSYYIYQANWTHYKTAPMIHLFPYWDFNPGQVVDVRVATNAPKFELYLNGELLATKVIDHQKDFDLIPTFPVPYQPGELKALAYDEEGNLIATHIQHSFTDSSELILKTDQTSLTANGKDLLFLEISTLDDHGFPVENANNRIQVEVSGPGRLIGLDNGDSSDYDQYKGISRRLFSGKLMAIIAATEENGKINVRVTSKGLKSAELELNAIPDPNKKSANGKSTVIYSGNNSRSIQTGKQDELPLRKIEIISKEGQHFTKNRTTMEVNALLHPHTTSYQDLEWSVVNDAGIASDIAKVEIINDKTILTALGDGDFRIRCTSKNGTSHINLISELEMSTNGLGTAYKNPYDFISGGLYDYSKGELSSGNERGVATSRDGETQVGFTNIDFGKQGSDTIHLPIFSLSNDPYRIQIWEGIPNEAESILLADVFYQKESIWNIYQPETYQLSKQLVGLTSLFFVLQDKIHLKGFSFEPYNRAYQKNFAGEADHLYGDTFTKTGKTVKEIGNNVSLTFEDMDFGNKGVHRLSVCGHSPIDKNTIQIRFEDEQGQHSQLIEFTETIGSVQQTVDIEEVTGKKEVTFIFLPGSNFDFDWFQFE